MVLVNNAECPRMGTKGTLWGFFLAKCLESVPAVVPYATTLVVQVLPPCYLKFCNMTGCIT